MRDIVFRGKTKFNEWVEGDLIHDVVLGVCIQSKFRDVILPDTVSQYTGLTDRNGKRIFEGDILKLYSDFTATGTVKYGAYQGGEGCENCHMGFFMEWETYKTLRKDLGFWVRELEVCGNIWDTPELLKGETNENY